MNKYYSLINKMTVKDGKRDEVVAILLESGKAFNDNPACELYLIYNDKEDPNVIWVEDVWVSQEAHTAAMATPDMQTYITKCIPLLAGMPEQLNVELAGGKGL